MKKTTPLRPSRNPWKNAAPLKRRWQRMGGGGWTLLCWLMTVLLTGAALSAAVKARQMWRRRPRQKFVIVVDAGSTGTRMNAFSYDSSDPHLHLRAIPPEEAADVVPYRPGIRAYNRVETLPGLQTIAIEALADTHNTSKLFEEIDQRAISPLLTWARAVIPVKQQKTTPIRLLATAGVRGMTEKQQEALLDALRRVLAQSGFKFDPGGIEIMSGHQEGVLGWVALNHELGRFNVSTASSGKGSRFVSHFFARSKQPNASIIPFPQSTNSQKSQAPTAQPKSTSNGIPSLTNLASKELIGAIDLGGSSLEVTIPSLHPTQTTLQISGSEYWLESITFEDLGLNKAFGASLQIAASNSSTSTVHYPCLHSGYSRDTTIHPLHNSTDTEESAVTLVGTPSWHDCMHLAQEVTSSLMYCNKTSCFDDSENRLASLPLAGLSGFYVIGKFFQLENGFNLSQLEFKGERFCNRTWSDVQEHLQDVIHVDKYCFRAAFLTALLQSLFSFNHSRILHIAPESISWPIGAAFLHVQSITHAPKSVHRRLGPQNGTAAAEGRPYSILIYLMAAMGAVLLSCACLRAFRRNADRDFYGSLDASYGGPRDTFSNLQHRSHEIKRRTFSYRRLPELSIA